MVLRALFAFFENWIQPFAARDKSAGAGPIIRQLRWLGKEATIFPAPARPIGIGDHEKVKNFTVLTLYQDVEFKTDFAHVDRPGR